MTAPTAPAPAICRNCLCQIPHPRPRKIYCNSQCKLEYWNKLHPRINLTQPNPTPMEPK